MTEIFLAVFLIKVSDMVAYKVAQYVEDHTNFTTGPVRLKQAISGALWWLA